MEELYREISHLKQCYSNDDMETVVKNHENKIRILQNTIEKQQKATKDALDDVVILESTLDNKAIEIDKLNAEIVAVKSIGICCTICEYVGGLRENLTNHILEIHGGKVTTENIEKDLNVQSTDCIPSTSKCEKCDFDSDDENEIDIHLKSAHKLNCEECDFISKYTQEMKDHMAEIHDLRCQSCNESFVGQEKMKTHIYVESM